MSNPLLLLTGASGHLGFGVLVQALKAGWTVRATVRSESKIPAILSTPSIQALAPGSKLSFAIVPDILADDAYTSALSGVTHVIHCASPIARPTEKPEEDIIIPARKGTLVLLAAAKAVPSVKRVVVTSSIVAVQSWANISLDTPQACKGSDRAAETSGPWQHHFQIYCESKVQALNATDAFVAQEKPGFDVVNVMPSFIIGANELVTSVEELLASGTNRIALSPALGASNPDPTPGSSVYLEDVALVHVKALDTEKVPGNQDFIANSGNTQWEDTDEIVKKRFPEAVADGRLRADGKWPSKRTNYDTANTVELLGRELLDYEAQVVSVVGQYLELADAGKKA